MGRYRPMYRCASDDERATQAPGHEIRSNRTLSLALVGACCALVVLGGRGDDDLINLAALAILLALAVVGTRRLMQPRRLRPIVAGDLTHLRRMDRRDVSAVSATIDADVVAENRWDSSDRDGFITAVSRSALPSTYAICERRTGEIVGAISVSAVGELDAELGVWIGRPYRGRGYTSDALTALVRHLGRTQFTSIAASTARTNVPMQSALRRAGFAEQQTYMHQFRNGETVQAIRFNYSLKPLVSESRAEGA
jgi:RimJ/RimL family protein N-acetyltransferase